MWIDVEICPWEIERPLSTRWPDCSIVPRVSETGQTSYYLQTLQGLEWLQKDDTIVRYTQNNYGLRKG